jgi:hypothetical protein
VNALLDDARRRIATERDQLKRFTRDAQHL